LALILDTRFLLVHAFPPSREDKEILLEFQRKLVKESLLIPSIVVAEFIKVAGSRLGLVAAKTAVRSWVKAGARVIEITWEDAEKAGEYLLKMPEVPIADALIAAQATRFSATVVSDDYHFRALGIRTTWYKH
jgi:predicted nucleic acid-binding protein